jgi:SAM-dependent methyltransferase
VGVGALKSLLQIEPIRRAVRNTSDWIDLAFSHHVASLARVAPRAHGRLLDVGCGEKPFEHLFLPHVTSYTGIEYEPTFRLTETARRARSVVDMTYDGQRLPFSDGEFDTVLSFQVLEHTPHPAELVMEMSRVLRPGGVLLLSAPFSFRLHEEPHDYFRFSPHGLQQLCHAAGLKVEQIDALGGFWSLLGHKLNSYLGLRLADLGGLAQAMGKLGHEATTGSRPRIWTLPLVAPAMLAVAAGGRILDRVLPDRTESLGFTVVATRLPPTAAAAGPP